MVTITSAAPVRSIGMEDFKLERKMFEVMTKETLNSITKRMQVYAPHIENKAKPGQFIILRVTEKGERIPVTVAGKDKKKGAVTTIFPEIGEYDT